MRQVCLRCHKPIHRFWFVWPFRHLLWRSVGLLVRTGETIGYLHPDCGEMERRELRAKRMREKGQEEEGEKKNQKRG